MERVEKRIEREIVFDFLDVVVVVVVIMVVIVVVVEKNWSTSVTTLFHC